MKRAPPRRFVLHVLAGLAIAAGLAPVFAAARPAAPAAPRAAPLLINLDDFDKKKQTAALPNGITLGYVEYGSPAGAPLILIHGYTDNARDWVPLLPFLDPQRRIVLLDIRGHGASSKPDCCYARIDFAYDVRLLLDRLGIERADVVGHSLGSYIAQTLAEYWPERIRKLVLISSSAGPRPDRKSATATAAGGMAGFRARVAALSDPLDPDSDFMRWWYASPTPVDEEFMRRQRRDAAAIPVRVWLAIWDQGLTGLDLRSTLPWLKAPTLLMWGAKDFIFGAADRRGLVAQLPRARVIVYPEFGHNPFWEDPERVARDLEAFLRE